MKVKEENGKLGEQERVDILWHPLILCWIALFGGQFELMLLLEGQTQEEKHSFSPTAIRLLHFHMKRHGVLCQIKYCFSADKWSFPLQNMRLLINMFFLYL